MEVQFKNGLKEVLRTNEYALGAFVSISAPSIIEILAISGLDFVVIDMEHAPIGVETAENMIRAAEIYQITPIVRVTDYDDKMIGRLLDIGAYGVQVPMVHTAQRAMEVVQAAKYAPVGHRGISGGRGPKWGSIANYREVANRESMTVCMCESKEAVDNIEEIVKTPMLDVVFIGANDLSQSLGHSGDISHPVVEEHILRVVKACRESSVIPGIVTASAEEARKRINQGFRYVTVMNDAKLMITSASSLIANVRKG
jgi:2-keto-3-deoxy-L-rhamnonate aldolase RhmA